MIMTIQLSSFALDGETEEELNLNVRISICLDVRLEVYTFTRVDMLYIQEGKIWLPIIMLSRIRCVCV
jgi:hypothetical protein